MHAVIGVITKDLSYIDKILNKYDENLEIYYNKEEDYFYNPNGKFDWYSIGGRWNSLLETRIDNDDCLKSQDLGLGGKENNQNTDKIKYVDGARIKDIVNYDKVINNIYGFIYNNEWYDEWDYVGELYLNNMPTYEEIKNKEMNFEEYKKSILNNLDKDLYLVLIDIHY